MYDFSCWCLTSSAVINPRVTWVSQVPLGLAHHYPKKIIAKRGQIPNIGLTICPSVSLLAPLHTGEFEPKFVPGLTQVHTSVKLVFWLEHRQVYIKVTVNIKLITEQVNIKFLAWQVNIIFITWQINIRLFTTRTSKYQMDHWINKKSHYELFLCLTRYLPLLSTFNKNETVNCPETTNLTPS